MFTAQAPALLKAFSNATDANGARQITQALANCGQGISHRGPVRIAGSDFSQTNGVMNPSPWDNAGAWDAFNPGGGLNYVNYNNTTNNNNGDPGGGPYQYVAGDWYTYMGDTNVFDLAPRISNTYGGPTFQVAGNTYLSNLYTNYATSNFSTVNEFNVTNINGTSVKGDQGDPGDVGPMGAPGNQGSPGLAGAGGPQGWPGINGQNGRNGLNGRAGRDGRDLNIIGIADLLARIARLERAMRTLRAKLEEDCTITLYSDVPSMPPRTIVA